METEVDLDKETEVDHDEIRFSKNRRYDTPTYRAYQDFDPTRGWTSSLAKDILRWRTSPGTWCPRRQPILRQYRMTPTPELRVRSQESESMTGKIDLTSHLGGWLDSAYNDSER